MKKSILFLLFFAALASVAVGQNANDWFITVWKNTYGSLPLRFNGVGVNYTIKVVRLDAAGNEQPATLQTFTATNSYDLNLNYGTGTYPIYAYGGTFSQYRSSEMDYIHLQRVEQWGTTV